MTEVVMPGGEPFFSAGSALGVLLLHGLTGTTSSMIDIARLCAAAGYTVSLPRLPGHGTSVEDMMRTGWSDWSGAALDAYDELATTCERIAVIGLSVGGGLSVHVAAHRRDVAALVFINPYLKHPGPDWNDLAQGMLDAGVLTYDSVGSDVKKEGVVETSYDRTPIAPALSWLRAVPEVNDNLSTITAPSLLFTSTVDHVVEVDNGDELVSKSNGSVERVWLENSYHVATMDNDHELIETRTMVFLAEHLGR
ncbi:MAG: alpha/beta fold hydrolase [Acidimicrobiaceae bacterium]|nr:alpha/beta fold hydrolase [Acidimicrobiaceae bacterium]